VSETDWNSNLGKGFGTHESEDEYFHGTGGPGDTLTETWFWNFHVPEAAINCFAYCWVHPNLKVVSGGLFIYKGHKESHLQCELFEYREYMAADFLGNGSDIRLPNSFRAQVVTPLQHVHLTFDDAARKTSVDVQLEAIGDPIMRANNKHFEQVMRATGTLVLRGETYKVDCLPVRDRSWGEQRPESHNPSPPYTWVTGTFGVDLAFNVGSHDDPDRKPDWIEIMPAPKRIFNDGWVVRNGRQRRIVRSTKLTKRDGVRRAPVTHDYEFEDDQGEVYHITGRVIAQVPHSGWANATCHCGLVEWNWDDRKGYGETQEVQWNDYVWRSSQSGVPPR